MILPRSAVQVLIFLLIITPGFVFSAVRARRRGPNPEDKEFSVRLLRSFGVSAALLAVYVLLFGSWGVEQVVGAQRRPATGLVAEHPRLAALLALVLAGVVPALLAVLDDLRQEGRLDVWKFRFGYRGRYHPIPSAWDFAGPQLADTFVRVRLEDGAWVGGWFSSDSFLSSYPEPRDLFIQSQWKLDETGAFLHKVAGTRGVYVSCADAAVIEWIAPPPTPDPDQHPDQSRGSRWIRWRSVRLRRR
ncbi:DUF6338 family protein [Blastococcus sp. TF02A-26]|uniref:DUF6338 family protein n=1 Tax=Blastococcus sp. TF02A-26 TaxID=2250577 RepID=UPI000DE93640|nr:DUF6338 family protein [Blastococcus sp. TF02A-26]RBY79653.1 hypothetical protein DQ240_22505 [Blastococcus sp. TF02A-26]